MVSLYCFLDDVGYGQFDPVKFVNGFSIRHMRINGKPYKDPDAYSKKLLGDI